MIRYLVKTIFTSLFLTCISFFSFSQGEAKKWYFGDQAGLDFTTNPPTILTNGVMPGNTGGTAAYYSCSSISNASGNLLFYTEGGNVWNSSHALMSNGTGLLGTGYAPQGSIIVKQPGSSTLYYIFTVNATWVNTNGINYSIVDMSLSAGQGSVTTKNANLYTGYTSPRLTATRHCNGVDVWIIGRDWNYVPTSTSGTVTPNFRAYLLTSTGVSTTAVVSAAASYTYSFGNSWDWGCMKVSPNGKKLAIGIQNWNSWNNNNNSFELYDFDNTTGVVSNSLALHQNVSSTFNNTGGYSVEFSPDGTKLYGTHWNNTSTSNGTIFQWDLCAGSPTAIVASAYTITTSSSFNWYASLQLAPDGKIYCANNWGQASISVINNPNSSGAACNYSFAAQSISPKLSTFSLPNFMSSYFISRPPPTPFTHTVSNGYGCQGAQFLTTYNPSVTVVGCATSGYSLTGLQWNFGDPASGSANTATVTNPIHAFTTLGTYTVQLVLYYSCGGGTDTLKQVVNINQPCISVTSTSITCASLGSATVISTGGTGPFSYTWMPSGQTSSVATGLSPGTYTLTVFDFGNNFTYTATTVFTSLIPLMGNISTSSSLSCHGASTGTGNVTNLSGGSGTQNYLWTNGTLSYTTPVTNSLSAGLWTINVTDALTGCQINQVFFITQPPAFNLVLSSNTPTACAGTSVALSGTNSGGTPFATGPGYTYSWMPGPATETQVVSQAVAGTYVYTLISKDSYSCLASNTIAIDFIPNPVLSVSHVSICPLQTGTLSVTGASSYTWNGTTVGSTFTASPVSSQQYSVVGSALSCSSAASASIVLKPLPLALLNSNSPVCNGQGLNLYGNGGASYVWTGPLGFASNQQYPVIAPAAPNNSGVYNLTVTAANNCTASNTASLTVNPTPTVSALGSTVCVNQVLQLNSNSSASPTFSWAGPGTYTSNQQLPVISSPSVSHSGYYTVTATSAFGCTNTAIAHVTVTPMPVPVINSDSPKCFGTTLNFTASGGASYAWMGPNSFSSNLEYPLISNVTVPASGVYTLVVTTGPCVISTTHTVTINPLPVFTASSNTPCILHPLNLSVTAVSNASLYSWQGPGGFVSLSQNPIRNSSTEAYEGDYWITVTDLNTCQNSSSITVSVRHNPTVTASGATVCLNQPAMLKAIGGISYEWSGPGFYYSNKADALIASASNSDVTVYTVTGTAPNGCTATAQASLTTLELPIPSLKVLPASKVCLNSALNMEGYGGLNYNWTGPGNLLFSGQNITFTASSLYYAGIYTLAVTDQKGCTSYTTTTLSLDALPQGGLVGKMQSCVPFCSDFTFYSPSPSSSWMITTDWELNRQMFSQKSFSYCFTQPGDYLIKGYFTDTLTHCVKTETFLVNAYPLPVAGFEYSPQRPVENTEDVIFTNTSSGEGINAWNWHFIDNQAGTSSNENTSYFFRDAGLYPVALIVKNKWGCADSLVKAIKVETDLNIYVPNVFSPNGDDNNEVFLPVVSGLKFYQLTIFNRWGIKIFETQDTNTGWDGTFREQPCKSEVYVWKINASGNNGDTKELSGHVTLYR